MNSKRRTRFRRSLKDRLWAANAFKNEAVEKPLSEDDLPGPEREPVDDHVTHQHRDNCRPIWALDVGRPAEQKKTPGEREHHDEGNQNGLGDFELDPAYDARAGSATGIKGESGL